MSVDLIDRLGRLRRLPRSVLCLVFSHGTGADYVRLWCASRHLWPTLRLEAAGPARFTVTGTLADFLRRRRDGGGGGGGDDGRGGGDTRGSKNEGKRAGGGGQQCSSMGGGDRTKNETRSSSPRQDDCAACDNLDTVATAVLPRKLVFSRAEIGDDLRSLAVACPDLAESLRCLTLSAGTHHSAVPLAAFPRLRHAHGIDLPGSFLDQEAPTGLECVQIATHTATVSGLSAFDACTETLVALGGVTMRSTNDFAKLGRFRALLSLRCELSAPYGSLSWRIPDDGSLFSPTFVAETTADREVSSASSTPSRATSASWASANKLAATLPSLSSSSSPSPLSATPLLERLTLTVAFAEFRVSQLAALSGSLRALQLEQRHQRPSLAGLDLLTRLERLTMVGDCAEQPYAVPPSLTDLRIISYEVRPLALVAPGGFDRVSRLTVTARDRPVSLKQFPALERLSLSVPLTVGFFALERYVAHLPPCRAAPLADARRVPVQRTGAVGHDVAP